MLSKTMQSLVIVMKFHKYIIKVRHKVYEINFNQFLFPLEMIIIKYKITKTCLGCELQKL